MIFEIVCSIVNNPHEKRVKEKNIRLRNYPNGTLLWSQRCVQPKPVPGMTSDFEAAWSLKENDRALLLPFCFWFPEEAGAELCLWTAEERLSPLTFSVKSGNPEKWLTGEDGEEFKETTDGGEVNEAGARTVKVRSSDVRFVACRVNTCKIVH